MNLKKSDNLFTAIEEHDIQKVSFLLKHGASPNEPSDTLPFLRPLHAAISEIEFGGSIQIVEKLIEAGADVNGWDIHFSYKPLHIAVDSLNIDCISLLLKSGADASCISDEGETPLMYAVESDSLKTVKILLKYGAKKTINEFGLLPTKSALNYAVYKLDASMVKLLLDNGADPRLLDENDSPSLDYIPKENSENFESVQVIFNLLNRSIVDKDINSPIEIKTRSEKVWQLINEKKEKDK